MDAGKYLFAGRTAAAGAAAPVLMLTDHSRTQQFSQGVPPGAHRAGEDTGVGQILPPVLQHLTDAGIARQRLQLQVHTTFPGKYNESIYYNPFYPGRKELFSKIPAGFSGRVAFFFHTHGVFGGKAPPDFLLTPSLFMLC
jgi:hypothetical protein